MTVNPWQLFAVVGLAVGAALVAVAIMLAIECWQIRKGTWKK